MNGLIVALAGLPGTGKTALARALAGLDSSLVVLNKDDLRPVLLPGRSAYDEADNDFVVGVALEAAAYVLSRGKAAAVVLDGRTFTRRSQRRQVEEFCLGLGLRLVWVELVCDEEIALERVRADQGSHPATDRDAALYRRLRDAAEPFDADLRIDSGATTAAEAAQIVHGYTIRGA